MKWLVFVKTLWKKADKELPQEGVDKLQSFCKKLNFYNALSVAVFIDLVDFNLHKRLDAIRQERNNMIHQFWIYSQRNNSLVLRKKLEKLARVTNQLVGIFNQLTKEVGVEEVYEIFIGKTKMRLELRQITQQKGPPASGGVTQVAFGGTSFMLRTLYGIPNPAFKKG